MILSYDDSLEDYESDNAEVYSSEQPSFAKLFASEKIKQTDDFFYKEFEKLKIRKNDNKQETSSVSSLKEDQFSDVLNLLNTELDESTSDKKVLNLMNDVSGSSQESDISILSKDKTSLSDSFKRNYIPKKLLMNNEENSKVNSHKQICNHYELDINYTYINNFNNLKTDNIQSPMILNMNIPNFDRNHFNINVIKKENSKKNDKIEINKSVMELIEQKRFNELECIDVISYIVLIAKDPLGCRFLQHKILELKDLINEPIYQVINKNILDLSLDSYGNYFVQILIEYLNEKNLLSIINIVCMDFLNVALSPYGTRVIQKIIETVIDKFKYLQILLQYIKNHILELFKNQNSIHIVQKLIFSTPFHCQFVYDCIYDNIINISIDKNGCCIMQKCIETGNIYQRNNILKLILFYNNIFMTDQYANYVLQYIISLGDQIFLNNLILSIKSNLIYFAKQKFSSNVLEKCFEFSNDQNRQVMIGQLLKNNIIVELLVDNYGNFVLQKAITYSNKIQYTFFIKTIGLNLTKLKSLSFGPKLYNKIINAFPELKENFVKKKNNFR